MNKVCISKRVPYFILGVIVVVGLVVSASFIAQTRLLSSAKATSGTGIPHKWGNDCAAIKVEKWEPDPKDLKGIIERGSSVEYNGGCYICTDCRLHPKYPDRQYNCQVDVGCNKLKESIQITPTGGDKAYDVGICQSVEAKSLPCSEYCKDKKGQNSENPDTKYFKVNEKYFRTLCEPMSESMINDHYCRCVPAVTTTPTPSPIVVIPSTTPTPSPIVVIPSTTPTPTPPNEKCEYKQEGCNINNCQKDYEYDDKSFRCYNKTNWCCPSVTSTLTTSVNSKCINANEKTCINYCREQRKVAPTGSNKVFYHVDDGQPPAYSYSGAGIKIG